ncbi:MAG: MgtC/SapB family protein [Clostridia bacterium]|nr:MgtC/SapB family protein [Clostridia bacterium]
MNFIYLLQNFIQLEPIDVLIKLILIYILAGFIGLERAALSKPAGFRTHVLVGMSAVLTVVCAHKIAEISGSTDFSRIPAQLLSGIGFLGAGTVLKDGFNVKGLTTAASLLAITCIGLCVGAGLYLSGIIATAVVYVVLKHSSSISEKVGHFHTINLHVETPTPKEVMNEVQIFLDRNKIEVKEIMIEEENSINYIKITGKHRDEINKNRLLSDLLSINNITKVQEIEDLQD